MKITVDAETLRVSDLRELNETRAEDLLDRLREVLAPGHGTVEFDLAQLRTIGCGTVDVLLTIHEELSAAGSHLKWRLLNPSPDLRQLFELVRLHYLFEINPPRPAFPATS